MAWEFESPPGHQSASKSRKHSFAALLHLFSMRQALLSFPGAGLFLYLRYASGGVRPGSPAGRHPGFSGGRFSGACLSLREEKAGVFLSTQLWTGAGIYLYPAGIYGIYSLHGESGHQAAPEV